LATYKWTAAATVPPATWEAGADWTNTSVTPTTTGVAPGTTDTAEFIGTNEIATVGTTDTIDTLQITDANTTLTGTAGVSEVVVDTSVANTGGLTLDGVHLSVNGATYTGTGNVTILDNGRLAFGAQDSNSGTITFGVGTSNVLDFDVQQTATINVAGMDDTNDVIALSAGTFSTSDEPSYDSNTDILTYKDASGTYNFHMTTTATAFHVVADSVNGGQGVDIVTGAAPPPPPPPPTTTPPGTTPPATTAVNFAYTDTTTGAAGTSAGTAYAGPVSGITEQYIWSGNDSVALSANTGSVFMHGGPGDDALTAISGTNVLDGGGGSNFLVGAPGTDGGFDTFFDDGRGGAVTWDTLVNFHEGDAVTIFGFTGGLSTTQWADNEGATGYQGATMHSELAGAGTGINASVTFAGLSVADAQAKLTISTGNVQGNAYLYMKWA
jgi:hypothetical protein